MKKSALVLGLVVAAVLLPSVVWAECSGNCSGNVSSKTENSDPVGTDTGNTVQNQNQVETQNEGEEEELQVGTQEKEGLQAGSEGSPEDGSAGALDQEIANVEAALESLLSMGGEGSMAGQQLQGVAEAQQTAQEEIAKQLGNMEQREGFMKAFLGPDYKALDELQKLVEQNRERIRELEQLRAQISNESADTQLGLAIEVMNDQNTALEEQIRAEEEETGWFGWLMKLVLGYKELRV